MRSGAKRLIKLAPKSLLGGGIVQRAKELLRTELGEGIAIANNDRLPSDLPNEIRRSIRQTVLVGKDDPACRRGALADCQFSNASPAWNIKPFGDRQMGSLFDHRCRLGFRSLPRRVDPIALPLEGVGRQRHAPAPLAPEKCIPIHRRAPCPELT